jgi:hypothetical protein
MDLSKVTKRLKDLPSIQPGLASHKGLGDLIAMVEILADDPRAVELASWDYDGLLQLGAWEGLLVFDRRNLDLLTAFM